ncbi:MAG: GNAT family N-acetyltransferase [Armatimonadetes bacterium]|nr:GNAT family N-acetyltransferase [Armatimonadota bacterium]
MQEIPLTLEEATRNPTLLHRKVVLPSGDSLLFRPLRPDDAEPLREFLSSLSEQTRRFWSQDGYDLAAARELCKAIGRYDKLRLVAVPQSPPAKILALYEFSFGIPESCHVRFRSYGIPLDEVTDCRFGPCVRDELQGGGLASALMVPTFDIARRFGKTRVFLWGGVLADNHRAIRFYLRHGFTEVGRFTAHDGEECIDMIRNLE